MRIRTIQGPLILLMLLALLLGTTPTHAQSLDGIWLSEGYGQVFEIQGD